MKETIKILSRLMCVMLVMFTFSSCSDDNDPSDESSLIGTWYGNFIHDQGTEYEYNEYGEFTFSKDGVFTFYTLLTYVDGTTEAERDSGLYKVVGNMITLWWNDEEIDEPSVVPFSVNGNKLTWGEGQRAVVLTKKK